MTTASTFRSELTSFVFADNQKYEPTNYANIYGNKNITMAVPYPIQIMFMQLKLIYSRRTSFNR